MSTYLSQHSHLVTCNFIILQKEIKSHKHFQKLIRSHEEQSKFLTLHSVTACRFRELYMYTPKTHLIHYILTQL